MTTTPEPEIAAVLNALSSLLEARGLGTSPRPEGGLIARHLATGPATSPASRVGFPAMLRQEITCEPDASGTLWWFWVWTGPDRFGTPDLEPLCPAADVEHAAARIGRVLELPSCDPATGS